jgi:hypothetical protein
LAADETEVLVIQSVVIREGSSTREAKKLGP